MADFEGQKTMHAFWSTAVDYIDRLRVEWVFFSVALLFGVIVLIATPPLQVPDEQVHFYRAYQVSDGQWRGVRQGNMIGGAIPTSVAAITGKFIGMQFRYEAKVSLDDVIAQFRQPLKAHERAFIGFPSSAFYSPWLYLPQASGIALGRSIGLGALWLLYLGRLFNLLAYIGLVWMAIRLMPIHSWVMALIVLLPMSLFMAASLSADVISNAVIFLFIAVVLSVALQTREQSHVSPWWIVLLAWAMAWGKPYLPLLGLIFVIPRSRFKSVFHYLFWLASIFGGVAIILGTWAWLVSDLFVAAESRLIPPGDQWNHIVWHPVSFGYVLVSNWCNGLGLIELMRSFIGRLGWLDAPLPYPWAFLHMFLLVIVAVVNIPLSPLRVSSGQKVACFLIFLLNLIWVSTWLYITYTPIGQERLISGFQARYLIPVAPLAFIIFLNRRYTNLFRWLKPWVLGLMILSLLLTILVLVCRYYWQFPPSWCQSSSSPVAIALLGLIKGIMETK